MLVDDNYPPRKKKATKNLKKKAATTRTKKAPKKAPKKSPEKTSKRGVTKKGCFVIMPFGHPFDTYYERLYKPAIEEAGLVPHRADDLYRPSTIVNDIWAYTTSSRLMLADLTGKNPNVFYELGLAHAVAKPVVLLAESMDDIPFDLRSLRILLYNKDDPNWGNELKGAIVNAIGEVLASPNDAVLPAFLTVKPERSKVSAHEKELLDVRRDLELLKNQIAHYQPAPLSLPRLGTSREAARQLIRVYLSAGRKDESIIRRLEAEGLTRRWIEAEIARVRDSLVGGTPSPGSSSDRGSEAGLAERSSKQDKPE